MAMLFGSVTNSLDGRRKYVSCVAPSRKRSGMEIRLKNKFFKRKFVPAAQSLQVERKVW